MAWNTVSFTLSFIMAESLSKEKGKGKGNIIAQGEVAQL